MSRRRSTMIIEDCSALGQISMVAATTILQALGITTALLPTALFSTQTEGFGKPVKLATQEWLPQACEHWDQEEISFSGALVGYLGSGPVVRTVSRILRTGELPTVITDPVMADQGKLYPGLTADYPIVMRQLCQQADIITPNWTELCLLAGQPVTSPSSERLTAAIDSLRTFQINAAVVVTGIVQEGQVACWMADGQNVRTARFDYFPGHFYGTGDTFTALLYGYLQSGSDLFSAVKAAGRALSIAVGETSRLDAEDRRYGLQLRGLLAYLSQKE